MKVKRLPWRIEENAMKAKPFVFGDGIEPMYPWYELRAKRENESDSYCPVLFYKSDGCCSSGRKLSEKFVSMEEAQRICQKHFENFILSKLEES